MLKLVPNPTFKGEVLFGLPDGGEAKLKIEFKHMGRKVLTEWIAKFQPKEDGGTEDKPLSDEDAIRDIVVGWEGVDAPFSKDNLEKLVDGYPGFARAAINVYIPALLEGQRKNSK